ncbi:uncharacterized protein UTRI_10427_B [Ustilago trichophora]|uniref:Uncharacterized protein n=1 Tax=Ustilago trichophora TaxID=86804 RepID=A0A5C3ECS6_9BASI|nr:uncharacterized protein UTRI_10427_B [Ustilago trichophora]
MRVFRPRSIQLLFFASITLAGLPFGLASGPELSELEQQMYLKARKMYVSVPSEANIQFREGQDLNFYETRIPELRTKLHEGARVGPGVILVGQQETQLAPKTTFYAIMIRPTTTLGNSMGLAASPKSPMERTVFAFWKHQGHEVKLLRLDTVTQSGAEYGFRQLESLIPLSEVTKIH